MFVPGYYYKGPKTWNEVVPKIQWCLAHLSFLVIPTVTIIYFAVMCFTNGFRDSLFFPWLLAYALL